MTTVESIHKLLEKERGMILEGSLTSLSEIAIKKQELLKSLPSESPSKNAIQRVKHELKRNEALIEAASLGIKSAIAQLKALKKAATQSHVYGPRGGIMNIASPMPSRFEKRS